MTPYHQITTSIALFLITLCSASCKVENHIDQYGVNIDSLKTLPDGLFAHRRDNIFYENGQYMIWYTLSNTGQAANISKVTDLATGDTQYNAVLSKYKIDTTNHKMRMQRFLDLSNQFKFGHIQVDQSNKISFSYQDGLAEQYLWPLNDSIKKLYLSNNDFVLLKNGWFVYQAK